VAAAEEEEEEEEEGWDIDACSMYRYDSVPSSLYVESIRSAASERQ
jgi:hypothetical protein